MGRPALGRVVSSHLVRLAVLLLFSFLVGCSSTKGIVRLNTGQGEPLIHVPRGDVEPLEVDDDEFHEVMAKHARALPAREQPLEFARQLFGVPERSGWYRYERKGRRLLPLGAEGELKLELSAADAELNRQYFLWCDRAWAPPPRDCLRLLVDSPVLGSEGKYALAMAIARGAVLGEMKEAFGQMVNPEAVAATLTGAMTMYLMLWLLPEPVSKGVAGLMTVGLVAYLGWDMVWKLVGGWRELVAAVDRATTFEELHVAGEKFAKVMGDKAAKAFVMLAMLAVGNTAAGMAAKMPTLPGAGQAAVVAEAQLNIRFTAPALAEVESVALSAEGVIVALAPNAVAMTARGNSGSKADTQAQPTRSDGPGEWVKVDEYMSESARNYQAQVTGAPRGHAYRVQRDAEKVDFDGFPDGVLLDAKGPNYAKFYDDELNALGFFKGDRKILKDAQRQLRVANGTPIRWIVAEEKFAAALRLLFERNHIGIEVVHVPPA